MSNSTHRVEVFRVERLEKHPNADRLNIVRIFDNYQAVVRVSDFSVGDLACYVPPDNVLPDRPEFAFLKGKLRIKAQKLRGIISQGLVLPAPAGFGVGDDVASHLGITHYVPGVSGYGTSGSGTQGRFSTDPPFAGEHYDLDTWYRYGDLIGDGDMVEITEKIHGTNARYTYQDGRFWAGSRNHFREKDPNCLYWKPLLQNAWLRRLCKRNPGHVIYGEIFGWVQDLRYGATQPGTVWFRVFDIHDGARYLDWIDKHNLIRNANVPSWGERLVHHARKFFTGKAPSLRSEVDPYVPVLYTGPYSRRIVERYISGLSHVAGAQHLREGIVIKPAFERWDPRIGRVVLKAVSPEYLERSCDEEIAA